MDSRFRGNDKKRKTGKKKNRKKEKQKKNFMLFMSFMVNFCVAVNGYLNYCFDNIPKLRRKVLGLGGQRLDCLAVFL